ncbi:MAG: S10 family peptidase [Gammaproteobacteria bacterium]
MRYGFRMISAVATVFILCAAQAWAATTSATTAGAAMSVAPPEFAVTHHSLRVGGETIRFTATAGSLILHNGKQQPTASVFFVAFTQDGLRDESSRPVTFLYNGGPGSASLWIELGAFGPMRVATPDAAQTPPAPYNLVANDQSLLDKSDLVFIDAPGTGFSRLVGAGKPAGFYGVDEDASAFAQFIRLYLDKYQRWNSPKFLLGESYGTTRSAALSEVLQQRGISLNGVILLSSILNFQTASFNTGNDLPYELYLPSYAAVAWYHKALPTQPKDFDAFIAEVEQFALGDYAHALAAGSNLSPDERAAVLKKLNEYTGLSQAYWDKANLRVNNSQFEKQLLRSQKEVTGRLDARFTGWSVDLIGEYPNWDPMSAAFMPAFNAAFHAYLQDYLGYTPKYEYKPMNGKVNQDWKWKHDFGDNGGQAWPGYTNVAPDLAMAMTQDTYLQVMVNSGYFDLGTPFFATDYTFDHLFDPVAGTAQLQSRIHRFYYQSGHMIYLHPDSLAKFKANVSAFMDQTLAAQHK